MDSVHTYIRPRSQRIYIIIIIVIIDPIVRSIFLQDLVDGQQQAPTLVALEKKVLQLATDLLRSSSPNDTTTSDDDYSVMLSHPSTADDGDGDDNDNEGSSEPTWWVNIDSDRELHYAMGLYPGSDGTKNQQPGVHVPPQHSVLEMKAQVICKNGQQPHAEQPVTTSATTSIPQKATPSSKKARTATALQQTKVTPHKKKKGTTTTTPTSKHPRPGKAGLVEQRILASLADLHSVGITTPSRRLILLFSGYKHMESKGFIRAMQQLSQQGYMVVNAGQQTVRITESGVQAAADRSDDDRRPTTTNADVHARIQALLLASSSSSNKTQLLFSLLADGQALARDTVMTRMGYHHPESKGLVCAIRELKQLGILEDTTSSTRGGGGGKQQQKMLQLTQLAFPFGRPNTTKEEE